MRGFPCGERWANVRYRLGSTTCEDPDALDHVCRTARRRSFLDPGSETKPFAQHYHDYAMSPSYTVFPPFFDYSVAPGSWSRMPLPGLYDVPGWTRGP